MVVSWLTAVARFIDDTFIYRFVYIKMVIHEINKKVTFIFNWHHFSAYRILGRLFQTGFLC